MNKATKNVFPNIASIKFTSCKNYVLLTTHQGLEFALPLRESGAPMALHHATTAKGKFELLGQVEALHLANTLLDEAVRGMEAFCKLKESSTKH